MILLNRILWLTAGLASTLWLIFRIIWPFLMMMAAIPVIAYQIFDGVEILALIISITLFLGMIILAISMICDWTWWRLKIEWKQIWQWK